MRATRSRSMAECARSSSGSVKASDAREKSGMLTRLQSVQRPLDPRKGLRAQVSELREAHGPRAHLRGPRELLAAQPERRASGANPEPVGACGVPCRKS